MLNKILYLYNYYGFWGSLRLLGDLFKSKVLFKNTKLIRFPFEIRGSKDINWGKGFTTGRYCRIETHGFDPKKSQLKIRIGKNCQLNDSVHIVAMKSVQLGDNVLIASRVFISDLNHGVYHGKKQSLSSDIVKYRDLIAKGVKIGDNVWIGEGCAILPGVTLGDNVIVGSNSTVTSSFPNNVIIAGSPARVIKYFSEEKNIWLRK